ncbi:hypothetical protein FJK98_15980 [Micromonospora sp. HM134]|uniref:hypothetical protein n=1 Tax=Micromonospora sp. HM134 TaxID=2583243 RepID=UPI0011986A10|nr:hypothetical protein [Micromonospora sp. HM134]QDY08471.1 hypothetical protein FJK98_15980 [Micromonospora sp. HM134]
MISSVTVCSSSKFYDLARRAADALQAVGLTVYTPRFDYNEEHVVVGEADKFRLTHEFLAKVARSDAVYVIASGGYTGVSVCIEVGYAHALGKAVLCSEQPTEFAVRALVDAVVPVDEISGRARLIGHRRTSTVDLFP